MERPKKISYTFEGNINERYVYWDVYSNEQDKYIDYLEEKIKSLEENLLRCEGEQEPLEELFNKAEKLMEEFDQYTKEIFK